MFARLYVLICLSVCMNYSLGIIFKAENVDQSSEDKQQDIIIKLDKMKTLLSNFKSESNRKMDHLAKTIIPDMEDKINKKLNSLLNSIIIKIEEYKDSKLDNLPITPVKLNQNVNSEVLYKKTFEAFEKNVNLKFYNLERNISKKFEKHVSCNPGVLKKVTDLEEKLNLKFEDLGAKLPVKFEENISTKLDAIAENILNKFEQYNCTSDNRVTKDLNKTSLENELPDKFNIETTTLNTPANPDKTSLENELPDKFNNETTTLNTPVKLETPGLDNPDTGCGGNENCDPLMENRRDYFLPTNCVCGNKKLPRVVGGSAAKMNEFPMMAGIIEKNSGLIHCGAVIISSRYTMTAAHCVDTYRDSPQDLIIVVGAHDISNPDSGIRFNISRFIIHEKYDKNIYDYDIALVELLIDIQFDNIIQPVCLPFKFEHKNLTDALVTFLGWGTQSFGGQTSDVLQTVNVTVISQKQCAATEPTITARQMCTFAPRKDACQFDSGGPALLWDPETRAMFLAGIISNGNLCGGARPAINTRVTELLSWIVNNSAANFCKLTDEL